jgi:hypothetical protein
MPYFFFFLNRSDVCSNNEESFILQPDGNIGNRIESITQRMAVIEGTNKVLFIKMRGTNKVLFIKMSIGIV